MKKYVVIIDGNVPYAHKNLCNTYEDAEKVIHALANEFLDNMAEDEHYEDFIYDEVNRVIYQGDYPIVSYYICGVNI